MPNVKVTLDLPPSYYMHPIGLLALAGPYSPRWKAAGIKVSVQSEGMVVGVLRSHEIVSFLIEWGGGEALTFVAGWLANMLRLGLQARIRGKKLPPDSTEEDILDVLRAAQGPDRKSGD